MIDKEKLKKLKRVLDFQKDSVFVLKELDALKEEIKTIELTPGPKGDAIKGEKGENGNDYVLTEDDKQEIANKITVSNVSVVELLLDLPKNAQKGDIVIVSETKELYIYE